LGADGVADGFAAEFVVLLLLFTVFVVAGFYELLLEPAVDSVIFVAVTGSA